MAIKVIYEELELRGFDAGGGDIIYYQGKPFTGIRVTYENGHLSIEEEFTDGHLGGIQRTYYPNGQMDEEYFIAFNTPYGIERRWDSAGNLINTRDFGPKRY